MKPWLISLAATAAATAAALWLWYGPWLWQGIPWLVMGALPFMVGLLAPKLPLIFAVVPLLAAYVSEGDVQAVALVRGLGACYIAAAVGILLRRLIGGLRT